MKKLIPVLAVSTHLLACGGASVDDSRAADSVSRQESAISATACQVNQPTRLVVTAQATKLYSAPSATSTVVLDLPMGRNLELYTNNYDTWSSCPTSGFFEVLDVNGNYDWGYVNAADLNLAGWAPDGNSNPQYPLTLTANTEANAAYDFLPDASDMDYWRVPSGGRGVRMKPPAGRNYNLQLVRRNADGTVTVLKTSTQTGAGVTDSIAVTSTDRMVRVVSGDGQYAIGPGNDYKIWFY